MPTIHFTGNESICIGGSSTSIKNSFTYEFWVKAYQDCSLSQETNTGISSIEGNRFVIGPEIHGFNQAGVGISVGCNGVVVFEHSANHFPAILVYEKNFSDWHHIAVVFYRRRAHLYIDGHFIKYGLLSQSDNIYPSWQFGGHTYGNFIGEIREIRVWKCARTEEQIKRQMYQILTCKEPNLLWLWNEVSCEPFHLEYNSIEVSIIVPLYNKAPFINTLLKSLERQNYPTKHMEVILVNDGSTDDTQVVLSKMNTNLAYKILTINRSAGRATARNWGAKLAAGSLLWFLDGEMIAHPGCLESHYKYHSASGDFRIVSGVFGLRKIYTTAYKEFSSEQISQLIAQFGERPEVIQSLDSFFLEQSSQTFNQFFSLDELMDPEFLETLSVRTDQYDSIIKKFGNDLAGFNFSWINFATGNLTIKKKFFEQSGGFDETFRGFGMEDWELGFRTYQAGAAFIYEPEAITYHQEHPIAITNWEEMKSNYFRFLEKHQHLEIFLLLLHLVPPFNYPFEELNEIIMEYKKLKEVSLPEDSQLIKDCLMSLLRQSAILFCESEDITNLLERTGIPQDIDLLNRLEQNLEWLRNKDEYYKVVGLFDFLYNL